MKIFNSLSGKKEEFVPIGDEVKMYVCGINPYDDAHIGHALSYIFFDIVRRYLEYRGYKVRHVQNITDIEDNIIAHANERGITVQELTQKYVERFDEDMAALNVQPAHVYPRAMSEIDKMLEIVQGLIDKGFAYAVGGNVYFRVRNMPDYGKLSHRTLDSMMAGARIEAGEEKEHPMDFILWKEAKPGEPSWDSPWGKGRPGWHIECSAMSIKYLGEQIDIHGGGQDVVFPHHENEIAQSESFTGKKPFVKYWMHNGLLQMADEKMSRSLGNLITIRRALEICSSDAIHLFVLGSYYRSPLAFSETSLEAAEKAAERLRQAANEGSNIQLEKYDSEIVWSFASVRDIRDKFEEAMDDDFGTPRAISLLFVLAGEINKALSLGYIDEAKQYRGLLRELGGVLGLTFEAGKEPPLDIDSFAEMSKSTIAKLKREKLEHVISKVVANPDSGDVDGYINLLSGIRNALRENKHYQLADEIRYKLGELGIALEDSPQGTTWKRKR
jgi:cysteinyl-tRNA synthetase